MDVTGQIEKARDAVRRIRCDGETSGLVPTMGALHEGHLSLIRRARDECGFVAVSIFVNPTQFAPNEDFDAYPRTREADVDACASAGVDLVFAPNVATMYSPGNLTGLHVNELSEVLCGPFRQGHFDGVATIVAKLLNIIPADRAYFGEKDYQQLVLIRRMCADLNVATEIVGCPTVREPDGLAMSSRNAYLSAQQREQALLISAGLFAARDAFVAGERDGRALEGIVRARLKRGEGIEVEYVECVDALTLERVSHVADEARICVAVRIGRSRLIDNVRLYAGGGGE